LNCEDETTYAFTLAGATADRIHLSDVFAKPAVLEEYQILAMIGGFSFGDHIAAGKVLANRYKYLLSEELAEFIDAGKLIIGICNGFQSMVEYGLLPGFDGDYDTQLTSLAPNSSGVFEDRWVTLRANHDSPCVFTKGIDIIPLPIRHGEGKFTAMDEEVLAKLWSNRQVALQYVDQSTGRPTQKYPLNPNGSMDAIAGICDPSGRVFGMMPHPEAYNSPHNHPDWVHQRYEGTLPAEGLGLQIFRNAVEYIRNSF
jgi:phosphoribosylformylglycinamidine synthase